MWTSKDISEIEAGLRARGVPESMITADRLGDEQEDSLLIFDEGWYTLAISPGVFNRTKCNEYEAWASLTHGTADGDKFYNLERALDRLAALMKGESCD